jgi:hypothetical protein
MAVSKRTILATILWAVAASAEAQTIDLAEYFPAKTMSRGHSLSGTDGNVTFGSVAGDFDMFSYGNGEGAYDLYAVLHDAIIIVAQFYPVENGQTGSISYAAPYASFPRYLDIATLADARHCDAMERTIRSVAKADRESTLNNSPELQRCLRLHQGVEAINKVGNEPAVFWPKPAATYVTISRDGALIRLRWWSPESDAHETLWIGEVPIAGTSATAPGLARYATEPVSSRPSGKLDSTFTWVRR